MVDKNNLLIGRCFRGASISGELSDSSIMKYQDSVKKFFAVIGGKDIESLTMEDFENFVLLMRKNGASNSRIANVISAVKWIILQLQSNGLIQNKVDLEKIKKPKIEKKEVVYLTEDEIKKFLDVVMSDISKSKVIRNTRFLALVHFLLQTGARIGETLSINIQDIDRENMEIAVIGKGKKPRKLLLRPETLVCIDQYLGLRKDKNKALFVSLDGESRWMQTDVGRVFRRYLVLSGIRKKVKVHTLRHTYATQSIFKGVPINVVQHVLGHSNLDTTLKYYIGAVEGQAAKKIVMDDKYNFMPSLKIPESAKLS